MLLRNLNFSTQELGELATFSGKHAHKRLHFLATAAQVPTYLLVADIGIENFVRSKKERCRQQVSLVS